MDKKEKKIVAPRDEFTDKDKEYIDKAISYITANVRTYVSILKKRAGNISSRELSRRTGVSNAVISDLEGLKYLPKLEVLLKLAYGMNSHFAALFNHMWNVTDAQNWARLTNTPCPKLEADLADFVIKDILSTQVLSLEDVLAKEGLSANDIKETLEFIEFKKSRQKRR